MVASPRPIRRRPASWGSPSTSWSATTWRSSPRSSMPGAGTSTLDELPSRQAMQTGQTQHDVLLCLPPGRRPDRWIEVTARPLHCTGQAMAVVSSLRDVTERHRAEESLRNAEHRQRVVLEHAVGGYAILGDDGRLDRRIRLAVRVVGPAPGPGPDASASTACCPRTARSPSRSSSRRRPTPGVPQRAELRVIERGRWRALDRADGHRPARTTRRSVASSSTSPTSPSASWPSRPSPTRPSTTR